MSIEIKELVIRATVEQSQSRNQDRNAKNTDAKKATDFADNVDMILQLLKDKKER